MCPNIKNDVWLLHISVNYDVVGFTAQLFPLLYFSLENHRSVIPCLNHAIDMYDIMRGLVEQSSWIFKHVYIALLRYSTCLIHVALKQCCGYAAKRFQRSRGSVQIQENHNESRISFNWKDSVISIMIGKGWVEWLGPTGLGCNVHWFWTSWRPVFFIFFLSDCKLAGMGCSGIWIALEWTRVILGAKSSRVL